VGSLHYARELSENLTAPLKVHMKLDTGMSRTGFDTVREAAFGDIVEALSLPKLDFEGVFTHFAVSDVCGDGFTQVQYERFASAVARAEKTTGHSFAIKHCANSGAVINYKQLHCDMVRPGVITYGMYPDKEHGGLDLRPAMEVKSRVYAITTHEAGDTVSYGRTFTAGGHTRLAVVPIGYADGLHRVLSNKLEVLIRGRRCRQVGRICMDMCMVDITDLPECREGDIVTIIGRDGYEVILADELAEKAGTINYEITCAFTNRVPRLYV
jgi:alanine racemase